MDVAKLAGVSRQVAGSVLNGAMGNNSRASEATVQRITQAAEQLNYKPNLAAMRLRGRRAHLYGLLVASAGDPLRAMLVQQLDVEAAKHECQMLIANTLLEEGKAYPNRFDGRVEEFAHRGVDGILCAVHAWHRCDRAGLIKAQPNTVFYDDPNIPGAACVVPDIAGAVRKSVAYLVGKGRRRIALVTMSRTLPWHLERVKGYKAELAAQGLPFDRSLLLVAEEIGMQPLDDSGSDTSLDYPAELPQVVIDRLIVDAKADAVICHDDFLAAFLLRRLRAKGLAVPKDVAVVGYLDHALDSFTDPPLTTVNPQYHLAAENMVRMLERLIQNEPLSRSERTVRVEPKLVTRESA
jgi:DNA-binding LacI/PurR family transcriptional regulator